MGGAKWGSVKEVSLDSVDSCVFKSPVGLTVLVLRRRMTLLLLSEAPLVILVGSSSLSISPSILYTSAMAL